MPDKDLESTTNDRECRSSDATGGSENDCDCDHGHDPGSEAVVEWRREFPGPVRLDIDQNAPGPIRVEGWDKNEVHVRAIKHLRAGAGENARRLLAEAEVRIDSEGDEVRVETELPRPLLSWGSSPRANVELIIRVPMGSDTDVDSGSGRVEVKSTLGCVRVDSGSGSVTVYRAAGDVEVDSGSGSVSVEETKGDVEIDVGSGSIRIVRVDGDVEIDGSSGSVVAREVEGRVFVDTASGSVELSLVSGEIVVDTASGGVRLNQVQSKSVSVDTGSGSIGADFEVHPAGRYRFKTGSGRVVLTVPDDASFILDAETGSGRIVCLTPIEATRSSRHHLQGTAGDGGARIEAETSSGSVTLKTRSGGDGGKGWSGPGRAGARASGGDRAAGREYREAVLKMVQEGKVTAEQARELLEALGAASGREIAFDADPSGETVAGAGAGESEPPSKEAGTAGCSSQPASDNGDAAGVIGDSAAGGPLKRSDIDGL